MARNATFQNMASGIAKAAVAAKGDLDKLLKAKFPGGKSTVADTVNEMIGTIGENMTLRRTAFLAVKTAHVASYMHNTLAPGLGKIGVIVALESRASRRSLRGSGNKSLCTSPRPIRKPSTSKAWTRPSSRGSGRC